MDTTDDTAAVNVRPRNAGYLRRKVSQALESTPLHVCRTAGRAERICTALARREKVPLGRNALRYLNRLSDAFFVWSSRRWRSAPPQAIDLGDPRQPVFALLVLLVFPLEDLARGRAAEGFSSSSTGGRVLAGKAMRR